MSNDRQKISRRRLVSGAAAAAAGTALSGLPGWFVQEAEAAAQRQNDGARRRKIGPFDYIHVGLIGAGGSKGGFRQGLHDTRGVASQKGTRIMAVCDVDAVHRAEAAAAFGPTTAQYEDYRELLARRDLDAVVIGTPDHWHAIIALAAMKAGKDVYCEKPLTHNIEEGRQLVRVARETGTVFQVGSQQRSDQRFRLACELVRNGRIGKVTRVEAHLPGAPRGGPFEPQPVPEDLNWDKWLGPAPATEYLKERAHGNFRYWYEYAGGMVTDWGAHHLDITQWGLGTDDSGPILIEAVGVAPEPDPLNRSYNVHTSFDITYTYPGGVTVLCTNKGKNGVRFEGENGAWIFVSRGEIEASDPKLISEPLPEDRAVKLYVSHHHQGNWVDCIRSREKPICDVEIGHRSVSVCHLGNISLRLGNKPLEWDAKKEEFKNNREANALRSREMRKPWTI